MALDYENIILISHEDTTKDITKKGGDKLTSIKPNLADKVANKVAGMVDIVARVVADGDIRTLSFKTNEVIFGGGRLATKANEISLDLDAFLEVYADAMGGNKPESEQKQSRGRSSRVKEEKVSDEGYMTKEDSSEAVETPETTVAEVEPQIEPEVPAEDKPRTRTRRTRN